MHPTSELPNRSGKFLKTWRRNTQQHSILKDFNTSLSIMDKTTIRKNMEVEEMNNIIGQLDLTHIYRTLYLKTAEYTFFSTTYEHSLGQNMIGHKSLKKLKKTEIQCLFQSQWNETRNK